MAEITQTVDSLFIWGSLFFFFFCHIDWWLHANGLGAWGLVLVHQSGRRRGGGHEEDPSSISSNERHIIPTSSCRLVEWDGE